MRTPEPTPLSFVGGVDNRAHVTALAEGHVRVADNVDIDARGIGRTREGYARVTALAGAHSLWTDALLTFALVADATTLYRLDTDGTLTSLLGGLGGGALSYAVVAGKVRWSNGVQTGQVALDGTVQPLGVGTPLPSYGVAAVAHGGLAAGRYGVAMTFADARHEEGGAPETVYVDVAEGGGITLLSDSVRPHRWQPTRIPCPWDSPGKSTGVGCHFLLQCMKVKSESEVAQSCPTLADQIGRASCRERV